MKKLFILLTIFTLSQMEAQEYKPQVPQVTVSGEGKIKVTPDQAQITVSIDTKGSKAADVKKLNDIAVDKVLQYVRKMKLPKEDVLTQRVSLNPNYDYQKKTYNYQATQTILITLKDLSIYDELSEGLIDNGVNRIDNVEFKSSNLSNHQSNARKAAMLDAKHKAEDYVSVINQKIGKALLINDNSQTNYPQPMYKGAMMAMDAEGGSQRQTLAVGEIEVIANVTVSFLLD